MRRGEIAEPPAGRALYLRMTGGERLQHAALTVSFVLLVITGFMLRYPEATWVAGIRRLSSRAFDYRSLIHRISAVVMVAASLFHVGYVLFTRRGRQLVKDLWWRPRDLRDAVGLLKYNLGWSREAAARPLRLHREGIIRRSSGAPPSWPRPAPSCGSTTPSSGCSESRLRRHRTIHFLSLLPTLAISRRALTG